MTVKRDFPIKPVIGLMAVITVVTIVFVNLNMLAPYIEEHKSHSTWYLHQRVNCPKPAAVLTKMSDLAIDASRALNDLGVPSAACYGTLIGALRRGHVLPWDNNVDLCVANQLPGDFETIQKGFMVRRIKIQPYDSWTGRFVLTRDGIQCFLHVFTKCSLLSYIRFLGDEDIVEDKVGKKSHWLCPDGTISHAAQIIHRFTKPFPAYLLSPPFPSVAFGNGSINVTRGDYKILKYLYPESWWLDVRPVGC